MPKQEGLGPYFGRLPAELRLEIYGHLTPTTPFKVYPRSPYDRMSHERLAILAVSSLMRREALDIIYDGTTFQYKIDLGEAIRRSHAVEAKWKPITPLKQTVEQFRNVNIAVYNTPAYFTIPGVGCGRFKATNLHIENVLTRFSGPSPLRGTATIDFYECNGTFYVYCLAKLFQSIARLVAFECVIITLHENLDKQVQYMGITQDWEGTEYVPMPMIDFVMQTARRELEPTLGCSISRSNENQCEEDMEQSRCLVFHPRYKPLKTTTVQRTLLVQKP